MELIVRCRKNLRRAVNSGVVLRGNKIKMSIKPEKEYELPIAGFTGTPEEKDRQWFEQCYRGDSQRQLTVRAVIMGGILGMFMAVSNLYTTLKIGWSFGVV